MFQLNILKQKLIKFQLLKFEYIFHLRNARIGSRCNFSFLHRWMLAELLILNDLN